jgi:hypothetical protein
MKPNTKAMGFMRNPIQIYMEYKLAQAREMFREDGRAK